MNGHINNVTYLAWALETMPSDVYATHRVCQVRCCSALSKILVSRSTLWCTAPEIPWTKECIKDHANHLA